MSSASDLEPPARFLNHLVGQWELTGQMGEVPLQQAVTAKWTLGGLFVEVYCRSTFPSPAGEKPYEAVYYIGYNDKKDLYVMHLLDTFGVAIPYTAGTGRREGDTIPFIFNYSTGPFTNLFIWDQQKDEWLFELTYFEGGAVRTFATKRMVRT